MLGRYLGKRTYRRAVLRVPLREGCNRSLWWRLNADCTLHCRSAARFLRELQRQVDRVEVPGERAIEEANKFLRWKSTPGPLREDLKLQLARAHDKKIYGRILYLLQNYPAKTLVLSCVGLFRALAEPTQIFWSDYLKFNLARILSASLRPPHGNLTREPWRPRAVEQALRRAGGVRLADEYALVLLSTEQSLKEFRTPHELYKTEDGLLWLEVHSSRGFWLRSKPESRAGIPLMWRGKPLSRPRLAHRLQSAEAEACLSEIGRRFRITWPNISGRNLSEVSWEPPLLLLPEPVRALLRKLELPHSTAQNFSNPLPENRHVPPKTDPSSGE